MRLAKEESMRTSGNVWKKICARLGESMRLATDAQEQEWLAEEARLAQSTSHAAASDHEADAATPAPGEMLRPIPEDADVDLDDVMVEVGGRWTHARALAAGPMRDAPVTPNGLTPANLGAL